MIDIELIHDTVTTTLGVHDQVSLVISVGIIILTGSIFGSLMCVDADDTSMSVKEQLRRPRLPRSHGALTAAMGLGPIIISVTTQLITQNIRITLSALVVFTILLLPLALYNWCRGKIALSKAESTEESTSTAKYATRAAKISRSALVTVVIATLVWAVTAGIVIRTERVEEVKTLPTSEAMSESQRGYDLMMDKILEQYNVEIVSEQDQPSSSLIFSPVPNDVTLKRSDDPEAVERHYVRVNFIDRAVNGDISDNPEVQLLTPSGVLGYYQVDYDLESKEIRLIVDGSGPELEDPEALRTK